MLKLISTNTQKDKIINEEICLKIRITPIDEKIEGLLKMVRPCLEESN